MKPSLEQQKQILSLGKGHSIKEVCHLTGISPYWVRQILVDARLWPPRLPKEEAWQQAIQRYKEGEGLQSIAHFLGLHKSTVRKELANRGVTIHPRGGRSFRRFEGEELFAEIVRLKKEYDWPIWKIARHLHVQNNIVQGTLQKAGIKTSPRPRSHKSRVLSKEELLLAAQMYQEHKSLRWVAEHWPGLPKLTKDALARQFREHGIPIQGQKEKASTSQEKGLLRSYRTPDKSLRRCSLCQILLSETGNPADQEPEVEVCSLCQEDQERIARRRQGQFVG